MDSGKTLAEISDRYGAPNLSRVEELDEPMLSDVSIKIPGQIGFCVDNVQCVWDWFVNNSFLYVKKAKSAGANNQKKIFFNLYFMCMDILPVCLYVCVPYICSASGGQKRVPDPLGEGSELFYRYWDSNPSPLQQPVLLTAEPLPQPR